jgi:magnesium chelatase subunit I
MDICATCLNLGVDGHRGDIIMMQTAKTLAACQGHAVVTPENVEEAAELVLPHRVRRQPMQEILEDVGSLNRPAAR